MGEGMSGVKKLRPTHVSFMEGACRSEMSSAVMQSYAFWVLCCLGLVFLYDSTHGGGDGGTGNVRGSAARVRVEGQKGMRGLHS